MPEKMWDLEIITGDAGTSINGVGAKALVQLVEEVTLQHPVAPVPR